MSQVLLNGLILSSNYAILALGFGLIYYTTWNFHLAHGAVFAFGAYLGWWATVSAGLPVPAVLFTAAVGAAVLGLAIHWAIYRPLERKKASSEVVLIASLASYIVIVNLIALIAGNEVRLLRTGAAQVWEFADARVTSVQVLQIGVGVAASLGLAAILRWTRAGNMWRAVGDSPDLVRLMAGNVRLHRLGVFAAGSALAGLGGALVALDVGAEPHMGFGAVLVAITACIVGGLGRYMAPLLGAIVLGMLESAAVTVMAARWQASLSLGVLVLFLVFRPRGLLGRPVRGEER